jgi:nucleoside-diphosphate-sugar epimerase/predicted dehydrogenase
MRILVLASSSFAAMNLPTALRAAGHDLWTFNRGQLGNPGPQDLHGSYERLIEIVRAAHAGEFDVLINYAIVKNGTIEQNITLADQIMTAARALSVRRFVHISSISVLPSITGPLDEDAVAVEARWKGIYSRVKAAVESHVIAQWTHADLDVVRPGFILAPGLVDSMVGTGKLLPTGQVLGLGNRRTVIMLIHRDTVDQALVKIAGRPPAATATRKNYMLVAPNAPDRQEYLDFHCRELGRGWRTLHFPAWMWRWGLAAASIPLSLLKRRQYRLATLFEHNLNVRTYDCRRTGRDLELEMAFDWRHTLRELVHRGPSPDWPPAAPAVTRAKPTRLGYYGMGRIVGQKHLPGLARVDFGGRIGWSDPVLSEPPSCPSALKVEPKSGILPETTHVVITAPCAARPAILEALPTDASQILLEKPFATSAEMLARMNTVLGDSQKEVFVLHNYRFKANVMRMREHLRLNPPGALRAVSLHMETPSPANEQSTWMKQEWRNRIVLTDYAMHYLDICWMFCQGDMRADRCLVTRNDRGELQTLSAALTFNDTPCDILIRSGGHQRHCIIRHHFQNYSTELRFFPDVFVATTGGHGCLDDARLAWRGFTATAAKVLEKLGLSVSDRSHDKVLGAFTGCGDTTPLQELSLHHLSPFYKRLTMLADLVYGRP